MSEAPARGRLDRDGRLIEADPPLADLHARAGGKPKGLFAVPQVAALARLAQRLGVTISRPAIAADGDFDLDLWVRAEPLGEDGVNLAVSGWTERMPYRTQASAALHTGLHQPVAGWLWEADQDLNLVLLSPEAAAPIGQTPAELVGKPLTRIFRLVEGENGSFPILQALVGRRRFEDQLAELRTEARTLVRLTGTPLINGDGRFVGFCGEVIRADEDEVAPASAASAPAAFGERLDRALRDPLSHIVAEAEAMEGQAEGPLRRDYLHYAGDIASAGRHLLSLVDDLIDLEAVEQPGFAPAADRIDLAQVARHAASLLAVGAAQKGVRLDAPAEGATLPATGEYRRVLQIVMNVITNAIRYSPEGGAVQIEATAAGGFPAVTVSDQGKGIAEANQSRIFEKFERVDPTEPGGTGLGLYIARHLARAMKGDLTVESEEGRGARFTLTLPSGSGPPLD